MEWKEIVAEAMDVDELRKIETRRIISGRLGQMKVDISTIQEKYQI